MASPSLADSFPQTFSINGSPLRANSPKDDILMNAYVSMFEKQREINRISKRRKRGHTIRMTNASQGSLAKVNRTSINTSGTLPGYSQGMTSSTESDEESTEFSTSGKRAFAEIGHEASPALSSCSTETTDAPLDTPSTSQSALLVTKCSMSDIVLDQDIPMLTITPAKKADSQIKEDQDVSKSKKKFKMGSKDAHDKGALVCPDTKSDSASSSSTPRSFKAIRPEDHYKLKNYEEVKSPFRVYPGYRYFKSKRSSQDISLTRALAFPGLLASPLPSHKRLYPHAERDRKFSLFAQIISVSVFLFALGNLFIVIMRLFFA